MRLFFCIVRFRFLLHPERGAGDDMLGVLGEEDAELSGLDPLGRDFVWRIEPGEFRVFLAEDAEHIVSRASFRVEE